MQHEKNDMVHNMFIHFFRFFCYTFKLNKNIFGQKIVYVNVKYMVINKIKSVGLSYCDFVSKIKCSNWWKLMYNIFFFPLMYAWIKHLIILVTLCLCLFGYKYRFWLSNFSHYSLFTIHIIESLLWTSIFSLSYNVIF